MKKITTIIMMFFILAFSVIAIQNKLYVNQNYTGNNQTNVDSIFSDFYCNSSGSCFTLSDMNASGVAGSGDITAVIAGDMLQDGGTTGAVTLNINRSDFNESVGEYANMTAADGNFSIDQVAKTIKFASGVIGWINGLMDIRIDFSFIKILGFYSNTEVDTIVNNNATDLRNELQGNIDGNVTVLNAEDLLIRQSVLDNQTTLRTELQGNIDANVTVLDAEDVLIRESIEDNNTDKVTIGSVGLVTLNMSNVTNLVGVASCAADEKPTNITINNSGVFLTCVADPGGVGSGNVSGAGTTNFLIMWENPQNITNSPAFVTAQDDVNFTKAIIIGTTSTANLGAIRTNGNALEFYNGTDWLSVSGGAGAADTTCEDVDCVFDSGDTGYVTVNLDFAGYISTGNCTAGNIVQNVSVNSAGLFVSCVADLDTIVGNESLFVNALKGNCSSNQVMKGVLANGTANCVLDNNTVYDDTGVRQSIEDNRTELNNSLPNDYYLQGQIDDQHTDINRTKIDDTNVAFTNKSNSFSKDQDFVNITITDRIFLGDENHWIKRNSSEIFNGIASETFWIHHDEDHGEGTVAFLISVENKTLLSLQVGRNNSAGTWGNSLMIMPNNLTETLGFNFTKSLDCLEVYDHFGKTPFLACDTSGYGASVIIHGGLDIWRQLFVGEGIRVSGTADFFMGGNDFGVVNGSLHIRDFRIELVGVAEGDRGTIFSEDFESGTLGKFDAVTTGGGANEWLVIADANCFNDQCARAQGGGGNPGAFRVMETNISNNPFDQLNLSFDYTTVNLAGNDLLNVTVDNNSGEGETELFLVTTALSNQTFNRRLNVSEDNASNMTIRFYFNGNNAADKAFINNVHLTGIATESTEVNLTIQDAEIKLGDGTCTIALNGSNPQTLSIGENSDCNIRLFNTTVVTQTVETQNVSGDQNVGGNFNLVGILNSPNMNETIADIAFNETNLLAVAHTQALHETLGIITTNNETWITDNQREGLNVTTSSGGDVSGPFDAILVETTQGLSVNNITNLNGTIDELANYTGTGNITVLDKVIALIAVNLDEMDNSVSAFITNAVNDLTNYFPKSVINILLGDINSTIDTKYIGGQVNESVQPNQHQGVNTTSSPTSADISGSYSAGLTIDANAVQEDEIDFTAVTLADYTNDPNFMANDTDGKLLSLNMSDGSLNTVDCINFTNGATWCGTE